MPAAMILILSSSTLLIAAHIIGINKHLRRRCTISDMLESHIFRVTSAWQVSPIIEQARLMLPQCGRLSSCHLPWRRSAGWRGRRTRATS